MIKFGSSGVGEEFYALGYKHTIEAADYVFQKGLNAFEYSFGRGINMSDATAREIGYTFERLNVELSCHAPYYVNFATTEHDKELSSYNYVIDTAYKTRLLSGRRVVFHPAAQGKASRESAFALTKTRFIRLAEMIKAEGLDDMMFLPETMGKLGQIGTVEEVVELCKTDEIFTPTIDFGHVNARTRGGLKTEEDYLNILDYMINELGYERVKHFHVHFSKIQYSDKGEVRHLTMEDEIYGPPFPPLASALIKRDLEPVIISESSGTQVLDAVLMKDIYEGINK